MKKLTTLSILFVSLAFVVPMQASAATSAGVKPGSFFYFFDTTFENIGLFFTFDPEQKAKKALEYADERLSEIEAIAEEENPGAVKTAIANYESNIALATEKSKEVKDNGQAESLFTSIADNASRNQEVLSAVLIKVPEEAKAAITQAIEASKRGQEEAAKQIAELKGEIEKLKNEVAELKAKEETNASTDLKNQKPENTSAPAKSQTSSISETTRAQKSTTPAPAQIPSKTNELQSTKSTNQSSGEPNNVSPQITQPQTVIPTPLPPITAKIPSPTLKFNQISQNVSLGVQGFKVSWTSAYVEFCSASGAWSGSKSTSGEESLSFSQVGAHTYTLTCAGKNGEKITESIVIKVIDTTPKITFSFNGGGSTANTYTAKVGDTVRLGWSTQNSYGGKCTASGNWNGEKTEGNSENITLTQAGTLNYILTCMNGRSGERGTNTATIIITAPSCQEDTWSCGDWNSCSASGNQNRSCTKTFDCSSANNLSPSTSQSCTPPAPSIPLDVTDNYSPSLVSVSLENSTAVADSILRYS